MVKRSYVPSYIVPVYTTDGLLPVSSDFTSERVSCDCVTGGMEGKKRVV